MRYTVSWAIPTALAMLGMDSEVDKRIRIQCTTSSGKRRGISEDNWLIFYFARVGGCGSALLDYFDTHNKAAPNQRRPPKLRSGTKGIYRVGRTRSEEAAATIVIFIQISTFGSMLKSHGAKYSQPFMLGGKGF